MVKDKAYGWIRSDLSGTRAIQDRRQVQKLLVGLGYRVRSVFVESCSEDFEVVVDLLGTAICGAIAAPSPVHVEPWLDRLRRHVDVYVPDETGRTWARCFRRIEPQFESQVACDCSVVPTGLDPGSARRLMQQHRGCPNHSCVPRAAALNYLVLTGLLTPGRC